MTLTRVPNAAIEISKELLKFHKTPPVGLLVDFLLTSLFPRVGPIPTRRGSRQEPHWSRFVLTTLGAANLGID